MCSPRNVEQARELGADRVVDYTQEDFTKLDIRHDLLIDIAGSKPFSKLRSVLTPEAAAGAAGCWAIAWLVKASPAAIAASAKAFLTAVRMADLLKGMLVDGKETMLGERPRSVNEDA
mgnify:CR=1 FL=1